MTPLRLVLASTSKYRTELLSRLHLPFDTVSPDVIESRHEGESGPDMCIRLAALKARAVATRAPGSVVIGSDQCAVRDGEVLGKPGTVEIAREQLQAASGRHVDFHTAVCVIDASGDEQAFADITRVRFRRLDAETIRRYVDIERPLDCAGSFKVEGLGISLFESVESRDPTALIGLPLIQLAACLRRLGYELP